MPKVSAIQKALQKMLVIKNPLTLYKDFFAWAKTPKMLVLPEKNTLEWEDVFPFLYLLDAFEGLGENRGVKHLVIDEMQDYTPVQFVVLNRLYPCQKTILGDFGQALNPCHPYTLENLMELYPDAQCVFLNKSYRSTCEIMSLANGISNQPNLEMVQRHGSEPRIISCESEEAEVRFLSEQIGQFLKSGHATLGIVTKTSADAKCLFDSLSCRQNVNLLTQDSTQFKNGVSIVPIQMAKGLEFDAVIVLGVSNTQYDADYERNLLYVACTRAMHQLTLTYAGKPSRFIPVR